MDGESLQKDHSMIITAGCSFTRYKWKCWPDFLRWFEPTKLVNLGSPGSSNETISRTVIDSIFKYKVSKVFIMWSGVNRYEIVEDIESNKIENEKIQTYSKWNQSFEWNNFYGGHKNKEFHEYYQRHFLNERQNYVRTLERILYTQHMLDKHNIDYKMMVFKEDVLEHNVGMMSDGYKRLYKNINFDKFIFYKNTKGLNEFAHELYPKEFFKPNDLHPLPLTHYYWVKDVMFKTKLKAPKNEMDYLENFKKTWTI